MKTLKKLLLFVSAYLFVTCASYEAQVKNGTVNTSNTNKKVSHTFYLIGDAGNSADRNGTKALEALTTVPAQILGRTDIGNLNSGSHANFLITNGDVLDKETTI